MYRKGLETTWMHANSGIHWVVEVGERTDEQSCRFRGAEGRAKPAAQSRLPRGNETGETGNYGATAYLVSFGIGSIFRPKQKKQEPIEDKMHSARRTWMVPKPFDCNSVRTLELSLCLQNERTSRGSCLVATGWFYGFAGVLALKRSSETPRDQIRMPLLCNRLVPMNCEKKFTRKENQ